MKRASRIGPLAVTNEGTVFVAPSGLAIAKSGFALGARATHGWLRMAHRTTVTVEHGTKAHTRLADYVGSSGVARDGKDLLEDILPPTQNFCISTESVRGRRVAFPPALGRGPGSV